MPSPTTTGQTQYAEHAQLAYNDFIYHGDFRRAEALQEEAAENNVNVFHEDCGGTGIIVVEDITVPCFCVEQDDFSNANLDDYGE